MKITYSKKVNRCLQDRASYRLKGFEDMGMGWCSIWVRGEGQDVRTANRAEGNAQVKGIRCSFGINFWTRETAINFTSKLPGSKTQLSKHPPGSWQPRLCGDLLERQVRAGLSWRHLEGSFPQSWRETSWTNWGTNHWGWGLACRDKHFRQIAFDVYSLVWALTDPPLSVLSDLWHELVDKGHTKLKWHSREFFSAAGTHWPRCFL